MIYAYSPLLCVECTTWIVISHGRKPVNSHIQRAYDSLLLNPKLILVVLVSILIFFGYHAKDFTLDASADSLLLEDDADLKVFREIHERYPSSDLLIVTFTPNKNLFSEQALNTLKKHRM